MLYRTLKALISRGLTDGLGVKVDVLYVAGKLTDEQYTEVTALLQTATPTELA